MKKNKKIQIATGDVLLLRNKDKKILKISVINLLKKMSNPVSCNLMKQIKLIPGLRLHLFIVGGVVTHSTDLLVHYLVIIVTIFFKLKAYYAHLNAQRHIIFKTLIQVKIFGRDIHY